MSSIGSGSYSSYSSSSSSSSTSSSSSSSSPIDMDAKYAKISKNRFGIAFIPGKLEEIAYILKHTQADDFLDAFNLKKLKNLNLSVLDERNALHKKVASIAILSVITGVLFATGLVIPAIISLFILSCISIISVKNAKNLLEHTDILIRDMNEFYLIDETKEY
jgi:hypothetical protein